MLGVVVGVTLASWGSARLACNVTDPVNKPPPEVSLERLAATPKHAAIELQHRWRTFDFERALKLARGSLREEIAGDLEGCRRDPARCRSKRGELEGRVLTTATVLRRDADLAEVQITHHIEGASNERYILTLERKGKLWTAIERRLE